MNIFEELFGSSLFAIQKSDRQKALELQGCAFRGQESLMSHKLNPSKKCFCGRPNKEGATD